MEHSCEPGRGAAGADGPPGHPASHFFRKTRSCSCRRREHSTSQCLLTRASAPTGESTGDREERKVEEISGVLKCRSLRRPPPLHGVVPRRPGPLALQEVGLLFPLHLHAPHAILTSSPGPPAGMPRTGRRQSEHTPARAQPALRVWGTLLVTSPSREGHFGIARQEPALFKKQNH